MLGATVLSLGQMGDTYATSCTTAGAGSVCLGTTLRDCAPGCYCTGGGNWSISKGDFHDACSKRWSNVDGTHGAYLCPKDFPNSANKASKDTECYTTWGNSVVFYHTVINCEPGYYLPKKTTECAECPTDEGNADKYCPGSASENGFWVSPDYDKGLKNCASGYTPNRYRTGCDKIPDPVQCIQGSFLPANSKDCAECLDGFVCPGALDENNKLLNKPGEYAPDLPIKQGIYYPDEICTGADEIVNRNKSGCTSCGAGKKANEQHTECVDAEITVPAGEYLPANRVEPVDCTGAKKFCPGGKFMKKEIEQGRYDCPFNSTPKKINPTSAGFDGCDLNLTKDQMKNGISGNGECWKKTDPDDYRYCIYGVRFELPNNYMGGGKGPAVYNLPSMPYVQATIIKRGQ